MKTVVYVDGYNLYYSRLKHTNYKWLDLFTLFNKHILKPQSPDTSLDCIKFYTADIKAKFASHGVKANQAQQSYHRALESPRTGPVQIIKGYYSVTKSTPMRYKEPPEKSDKVTAWKLEEKQTDVNIALDIYRDVSREQYEQIVVCTNDSDIEPALRYVKQDFPSIKIGLVLPLNQRPTRTLTKSLVDCANWVRHYIRDDELQASQFSNRVPTNKKPVDKPDYW